MELRAEKISKSYKKGQMVLEDVSFTLTPGVYGLLGPNGAGKTTLMNILTDNLSPTAGSVLADGKPIRSLGAVFRERLGYMPQQQTLYPDFTVEKFLWYMAALKAVPKKKKKDKIRELLKLVNLEEHRGKKIRSCSGGMKQRLLIASALLNDPELLILDEPTAGLDPMERIRIRDFAAEAAEEKILLFSTHVVSDIEKIAKEVFILDRGRIIRRVTREELREKDLESIYMSCVTP